MRRQKRNKQICGVREYIAAYGSVYTITRIIKMVSGGFTYEQAG